MQAGTNLLWDVFIAGESRAEVTCGDPIGVQDNLRARPFVAAVPPAGADPGQPSQPGGQPSQPTTGINMTALLAAMAEHDALVRSLFDAAYQQQERMFADEAARLAELKALIEARPLSAAPPLPSIPILPTSPTIGDHAKQGAAKAFFLFLAKYGGAALAGYLATEAK